MPTRMELIEDGYIIDSALIAPWTLEDLFAAWEHETELRDSGTHRIHSILDVTHARPSPKGMTSHLRKSPAWTHRTKGIIVIIGGSLFTRALMDIAMRFTSFKDLRFMDSHEQALDYLRTVIAQEKAAAESEKKGNGAAT